MNSKNEIQVCFVNTEQLPIQTEHICFFTRKNNDKISLMEVVREFYPHPDAPENAKVNVVRINHVKDLYRNEIRASTFVLLEAAQNSIERN